MNKNKFSTKYLVEMALLVAIILLMAFTPIGYIKTAGLEITLIVVPVAVGAVTLGPTAGAILGGVFGITSFIQCFGMSQFGALLLGINPFLTFLVCVPTRILMGWLTGLIYHGLRKTKIPSAASVTIASLCCPLLNTTFFMGTLVTLFASTMRESFGMGKVLPFIFAFVGVNGVVEAIVCFVVGTAPYDAVSFIISTHLPNVSFRVIRIVYDFVVTAIAVLLGGKLGIVTVLMVITLGPVIEWLGNIMKQHLNIFDD